MDDLTQDTQQNTQGSPVVHKGTLWAGTAAVLFFIFLFFFFVSAPAEFPEGAIFNIKEGSGLRTVSLDLKNQNLIRSRTIFEAFVILYGGEKHIIPTDYLFENKESAHVIARRISLGQSHLAPVKITIPEGFNTSEIAELASSLLPYFDKAKFLNLAKEGYLFPDTYFFFTTASAPDVLKAFSDNYEKKLTPVRSEIARVGKDEASIIKMASVIEREAKGDTDRDIVSGILWKRISIGMPLQADAAPETYQNKGLPKNPIANPGLSSINAAINPKSSPYLYYLHDKDGGIHYAKNFTEHRQNINKYLK